MIDWSDAEASGLRKAVGAIMANGLLRGCQVHWARPYQRVADKVCRTASLTHTLWSIKVNSPPPFSSIVW